MIKFFKKRYSRWKSEMDEWQKSCSVGDSMTDDQVVAEFFRGIHGADGIRQRYYQIARIREAEFYREYPAMAEIEIAKLKIRGSESSKIELAMGFWGNPL